MEPMGTASPSRATQIESSALRSSNGRVAYLSNDSTLDSFHKFLEEREFSVHKLKNLAALQPNAGDSGPTAIHVLDVVLIEIDGTNAESVVALVAGVSGSGGRDAIPASVVVLAHAEQVSVALSAVEHGAYNFLVHPYSHHQLLVAVRRAMEHRRLQTQNTLFREHLDQLITARTQILQSAIRQLEQSYDVTLEALGNALDLKDAETEGHSKRVTAYTLALGRAVGLSEPQLRVVGRGAFLHDIGKMAIPDAILRKPGKLTVAERAIMRTHSELGYRMLQKIPYLHEPAEIVYSHQECYDGSGYPRGLRGEQIHIGARIFAIADTLDAMTSNRPYRKASPISVARKEVLRCTGTQFDPAIVDVFMATPDSIWQDLREGILRDGPSFSPFGYTFGEIA